MRKFLAFLRRKMPLVVVLPPDIAAPVRLRAKTLGTTPTDIVQSVLVLSVGILPTDTVTLKVAPTTPAGE